MDKLRNKWRVHAWMNRKFGKPMKCEFCGTTDKDKIYDWSNKDHKYRQERDDFQRLCRSCHRKYDKFVPPSRKGCQHTPETRKKISRLLKGKKGTKGIPNLLNQKPVVMIGLDGNKRFPSVSIASIETGISRTAISNVLTNRAKTAGNYRWKYEQ